MNLWHFMAGRGAHEKTIAQLKSGLAFHTVPTLAYAANSAWQQLVAITHNLLTNFQIDTGAEQSPPLAQTHRTCASLDRADAALHALPSRRTVAAPGR